MIFLTQHIEKNLAGNRIVADSYEEAEMINLITQPEYVIIGRLIGEMDAPDDIRDN